MGGIAGATGGSIPNRPAAWWDAARQAGRSCGPGEPDRGDDNAAIPGRPVQTSTAAGLRLAGVGFPTPKRPVRVDPGWQRDAQRNGWPGRAAQATRLSRPVQ